MTFPFRMGTVRSGAELMFDAAGDRLLELTNTGAVVVEGATSSTPHDGQPLSPKELAATGLLRMPRFTDEELKRHLNLPVFPSGWHLLTNRALIGPQHELLTISDSYVLRITHEGTVRAMDFGPAEKRFSLSLSAADAVLWHYGGNKMSLRRIALGVPALDATPENLGELTTEREQPPLLFANGDRAFLVADAQNHYALLRLPRGKLLGVPEPLPLGNNGRYESARSADNERYAFKDDTGLILEIGPQQVRVLARDLVGTTPLTWDAQVKCWSVRAYPQNRYFGDDCGRPQPTLPARPTAAAKRPRSVK